MIASDDQYEPEGERVETNVLTQEENLATNQDESTESEDELQVDGVDIIRNCLCVNCGGGDGVTRMMIHKIPYFRELFIASFRCPDCFWVNNEVTFGGEIQVQGQRQTLRVTSAKDLDRQLIKSDSASLRIEEIDFEIPPMTQKGAINTLEGFLRTAAKDLGLLQAERRAQAPEVGEKVANVIRQLSLMAAGMDSALPFHIILDDPAGNSFIQNPSAPLKDPNMTSIHYNRRPEQDLALGLKPSHSAYRAEEETDYTSLFTKRFGDKEETMNTATKTPFSVPTNETVGSDNNVVANVDLGRSEVIIIPSPCPNCQQWGEARTAMTDIPHFKEVLIMAFTCNFCGFRNNEVKGGGAVPEMGTEVRLLVASSEDLKRDVMKSDSSMVIVPELDLELQEGTLGGLYTTVEGLLRKIHSSLYKDNPFSYGDSTTLHHSQSPEIQDTNSKFQSFLASLDQFASGQKFPFTLILRDPLGNSFISAPLGSFLPPELDTNLTLIDFERTYDENEAFGLNDINTKDFESGVDAATYYGHILPDRITHKAVHGPDHPTFYAKGVDDATPGGTYLSPEMIKAREEEMKIPQEVSTENDYYQGPAGWVFSKASGEIFQSDTSTANQEVDGNESDKLPVIQAKRTFNVERDNSLEFLRYEEFSGRKEGYVFRMGAKGLGYYEDKPWI